jgi:hypothetical protein
MIRKRSHQELIAEIAKWCAHHVGDLTINWRISKIPAYYAITDKYGNPPEGTSATIVSAPANKGPFAANLFFSSELQFMNESDCIMCKLTWADKNLMRTTLAFPFNIPTLNSFGDSNKAVMDDWCKDHIGFGNWYSWESTPPYQILVNVDDELSNQWLRPYQTVLNYSFKSEEDAMAFNLWGFVYRTPTDT